MIYAPTFVAISLFSLVFASPNPAPSPDVTIPGPGLRSGEINPINTATVEITAANIGVNDKGATTWRFGNSQASFTLVAGPTDYDLLPWVTVTSVAGQAVTASVSSDCDLKDGKWTCVVAGGAAGGEISRYTTYTTTGVPTSLVFAGSTDLATGSGTKVVIGASLKVMTVITGALMGSFVLGFLLV